jgi:hypothetical protein
VQLKRKKHAGRVRESLGALSATLFAATLVGTTSPAVAQDYQGTANAGSDIGGVDPYSQFDSTILFYQENGGRVRAVEPQINFAAHASDGETIALNFVADSVTGATPNGAVPSDVPQSFVTPIKAVGSTTTVTSASGGSKVIQLPPTPGQIASAALGREYTVPANQLPMDRGFHDQRYAGTINWSSPMGSISQVGLNLGYSSEYDYHAITAGARIAQDFFDHNTTLSFAVNLEDDSSFPYGGIPTPLTSMNGQWKTPSSHSRLQTGLQLGLTQVMTRRWLVQLNYTYGISNGYQNDPYRILSVVDAVTGEPTDALYEARPKVRRSQSVYIDNKFDFGGPVADLSFRYFSDSWGISAETAELSNRVPLTNALYIEPNVRWYSQSAANFYHYYLVDGAPLPQYASSDWRLGKFQGLTYGVKIGLKLTENAELFVRGEYYRQTGDGHPADAIGQLKDQNLFQGVSAGFGMIGLSWKIP